MHNPKRKYKIGVKERSIHQEKGFILKNVKDFGLPPVISYVIEVQKWKRFASHPQNPIVPLVRKFYLNILIGVKVSFSTSTINMHLGSEDAVDDYIPLLESISLDELNRVLSSLTIKGTNWLPNKGDGVVMCSRPALHPIPKIWYHFIRTRLIPTTHVETVNKARLVLLHCIIEGKNINVGQIIQREIYAYSFKPKGCLFFPSLISELCLKSGVDVNSSDEILPNTAAISTIAIKRFSSHASKPAAGPPQLQGLE